MKLRYFFKIINGYLGGNKDIPYFYKTMSNQTAILALQKAREDVVKRRNDALRQVSSQFDEELHSLDEAIELLRRPVKRTDRVKDGTKLPYTGKKRGRKPKNLNVEVYPLNGSVPAKFVFIVREAKRFITIAEIAQRVKKYEPSVNEAEIKISFGKHVDKYRVKGYITSYQVGGSRRNTVYGLPEWLDEDGKPLPSREHIERDLMNGLFPSIGGGFMNLLSTAQKTGLI